VSTRARDEGVAWTLTQAALRLLLLLTWMLMLPLAVVLHAAGARRLPVITSRIGHLASEVDCFLKLRKLGRLPPRRWFIAASPEDVANGHLLDYWRGHVQVVTNRAVAGMLRTVCRPPLAAHDIAEYILTQHGAALYGAVNAEWGERPALLSLTDADREWGESMLRRLGVPPDTWFVCVHPRTSGFAPHDEKVHAFRNTTLSPLVPALRSIAQRGGYCVVMGHPSAPTLPPLNGVVDYAHHPLRSPRFDVVLCAMCRFFLGSSSGLFGVSTAFGIPCALANAAPLTALPYSPADLFVPKLYRSAEDGRLLRFDEILDLPCADYRHGRMFADAGIELVENGADDILDLVADMLEHDALNRAESDRFHALLKPHHYGYSTRARMSPRFLARHRHLMPA
jgi:putative glycosyltransferase (TIGR04372 family)